MAKQSACTLLMKKTYTDVWMRGKKYAEDDHVEIISLDDKCVEAVVKGTESYHVSLNFPGSGISKKCTCPYAAGSEARHAACKHMVAVAITWDKKRGLPSPDAKKIEAYTIPPSINPRAQVKELFAKPLQANLESLRTLVDRRGSWSRPHSKLPFMPYFLDDAKVPLDKKELEEAFKEMTSWTHRVKYDPYFCAGEMVAAYCEVMRSIKRRIPISDPLTVASIIIAAQKFHYKLVMELIDSSDGLHIFTEAHLEDVFKAVKDIAENKKTDPEITAMLKEYEAQRNRY